jgi:hypothetical protein
MLAETYLINEQNDLAVALLDTINYLFQSLFELAAIARSS